MGLKINYEDYFDKVYGCWLGKCICGTIGAPFEGMKQPIDIDYSPEMVKDMLPNDDLDLQVLWLEALERRGVGVDSATLAQLFSEKNIFWPGEYAWFKKNYDRHIPPPYTGMLENDFYYQGMGCPIRAEIWGMIFPGNPEAAAKICVIDGTLDHYGESVYFEQFWAAMIAQAFFESDLYALLETGMAFLPQGSKARNLVSDVMEWCRNEEDVSRIMGLILSKYGHRDCTNSFQNMGIIIMALLKGRGHIIDTTMMAVRQGFDTDCTAGNAGALLGLISGAKALEHDFGFKDTRYKLTIDYSRKTDRVWDLARDTCRVGIHFVDRGKNDTLIDGCEGIEKLNPLYEIDPYGMSVTYLDNVYLQPGDKFQINITLDNRTAIDERLNIICEASPGITVTCPDSVNVKSRSSETFALSGTFSGGVELISEVNDIHLTAVGSMGRIESKIGLIGKTPYMLYGPFWDNVVNIPKLKPGESYYSYFDAKSTDNYADLVRGYHLNTRVHPEKDYISIEESQPVSDAVLYANESRMVFCDGDIIDFNDICPFDGQCAIYLKRIIVEPQDREVKLQIGHTDAFALWINGELIRETGQVECWTPENVHISSCHLQQGENTVVIKLIKRSLNARFSLTFLEKADAPKHIVGMVSKVY